MKTPLFSLMVVFICGFALHLRAARRHSFPASSVLAQAEADAASVEHSDLDEVELERKRFRMTVAAASVILGGLFLFVVLISLVRMSRARRRLLRLGQKNAPTEYIDAWSNYRLDEDSDEQVPSGD